MIICEKCGQKIKDGYRFCPVCGKSINSDKILCTNCNTLNTSDSKFCIKCGRSLQQLSDIICEKCGAKNDFGSRICKNCGNVLKSNESQSLENEKEILNELEKLLKQIKGMKNAMSKPFLGADDEQIKNLTYICPVCGKVNPIDEPLCLRCGRRRRRSSYLTAMELLKASNNTNPVYNEDKIKMTLQDKSVNSEDLTNEKINDVAQNNSQNLEGYGNELEYWKAMAMKNVNFEDLQNSPIIQPIAFVPYVSQDQPLWQTVEYEVAEEEMDEEE